MFQLKNNNNLETNGKLWDGHLCVLFSYAVFLLRLNERIGAIFVYHQKHTLMRLWCVAFSCLYFLALSYV